MASERKREVKYKVVCDDPSVNVITKEIELGDATFSSVDVVHLEEGDLLVIKMPRYASESERAKVKWYFESVLPTWAKIVILDDRVNLDVYRKRD